MERYVMSRSGGEDMSGESQMYTGKSRLLKAMGTSNVPGAMEALVDMESKGVPAWETHLSVYPVAQQVLNPPYINPHLPKMYRIVRELDTSYNVRGMQSLLRLEVSEYTRRVKLEPFTRPAIRKTGVAFADVEAALRAADYPNASALFSQFYEEKGGADFARHLLLLGSNYLAASYGHSVSCTAFILLEMIERVDQDPWPVLCLLADFFCKGGYHTARELIPASPPVSDHVMQDRLIRATSGTGFVNLHHTITLFALKRVRSFFADEEYGHMMEMFTRFLRDKPVQSALLEVTAVAAPATYEEFFHRFSTMDAREVAASLSGMLQREEGRRNIGEYLIRGICDLYQGDYDPHYLTGLAAALWVVKKFWRYHESAQNALYQYLDFYFSGMAGE
jgi:hypothetical protein